MNGTQGRSRARAVAVMTLALAVPACARDREPTGLSDARGTHASSQGALVYAEERRAVELAQVIPALAGFFFDTSGNVVVLLKGVGESQATKGLLRSRFGKELARGRRRNPRADLIVQTAKYTFLELKEWRDRLMNADVLAAPGVVWLDLDEARNRVAIGLDFGADPAAAGLIAQDLGVPAEAVEFEVTGPYVPQQTLRDEVRPIQGGMQIQRVSGTSAASCTLGFTAVWQDQDVFLTAGHCSPDPTGADGVEQFQPVAPLTASDSAAITAIGREIAHSSAPCGNRRCSYSDAAVYALIADTVAPIPSEPWILGRIAKPAWGCFPGPCNPPVLDLAPSPYWVVDTTHETFVVNDLVSKIGSATGWSQGYVQKTCVNVSPAQGVTYYCQMYANYGQDDGDSGAPILLDIQGAADSTVTLGGIHSGKAGKNAVFSPWSGIVQDYGSLSVVPAQQDTTRPPIPTELGAPSEILTLPHGGEIVFRNVVDVRFDDSTSGGTVRGFLTRYRATIVGGRPITKVYILEIPDPGPAWEDYYSIVSAMRSEPGVAGVSVVAIRRMRINSRFPDDAPVHGADRSAWSGALNTYTRSRLAVRAPLAWGCENGLYGGGRVRIGLLDILFAQHDLDSSVVTPWQPPSRVLRRDTINDTIPVIWSHGTGLISILAATGDNGRGIAGIVWGADLRSFQTSVDSGGALYSTPALWVFEEAMTSSAANDVRVFVSAMHLESAWDSAGNLRTDDIARVDLALSWYLQHDSRNVYVQSLGNRGQTWTLAQVQSGLTPADSLTLMEVALAQVRQRFPDQIITVVGASSQDSIAGFSDVWTGATDIAAPAVGVLMLSYAGGDTTASGNSFAVPFVGGVAALLRAMNPALTAVEVKNLIVNGARMPRWKPQTGQMQTPQSLAGTAEPVYHLDAYAPLQLAARRQGIPLCGNRVWVSSDNTLSAERDTTVHTLEALVSLSERADIAHARHGGRRVEVFGFDSGGRAFVLQQGQWVPTTADPTTPDGGTYLSLFQASHDLDSGVVYSTIGDGAFHLRIRDLHTGAETPLISLTESLAGSSDSTCVRLSPADSTGARECSAYTASGSSQTAGLTLAYSPLGDDIAAAITRRLTQLTGTSGYQPCPGADPSDPNPALCRNATYRSDPERTVVHLIRIQGGQDTTQWTITGKDVFWMGISEDGAQLALGEGTRHDTWTMQWTQSGRQLVGDPSQYESCGVGYRAYRTGNELRPLVQFADFTCSDLGRGTISPAPPVSIGGN